MIEKQPPAPRDLAKRALVWITTSGRPLSPRELSVAVAIHPGEHQTLSDIRDKYQPKTVNDACRGRLQYNRYFPCLDPVDYSRVRLVHNTVHEFLTSSTTPTDDMQTRLLHQRY